MIYYCRLNKEDSHGRTGLSDKNENISPIIEMHNVGIRYGQGPEILSDIKLCLKKGSFHFLTGKSGAGKTSLLSMMYLAQKPSRGVMGVFGKNINFANRDSLSLLRRKIGVVFQDFRLLEHMTAFDNVALPLRICGMNDREVRKRVTELLQWVELERNMYAKASTLSGGEKQRIAIARAVINRPELLLADEPTGNVDNDIAPKLMKLFVELNKLGTTVVIATHSEKLITDFMYPRLHLQNRSLRVYPPAKVFGLGGGNER
jgi:cell division ATP-binding protein ftsE